MFKNLRKWLTGSLIIASVFILVYSPVKAGVGINDIDSVSDYARASIERLVTKGIILGDDNGNFNPSATVTRAEMVTMVVKALNVDVSNIPSTATFKDVPKENWAFKYVEAAYKAGVINGVGDGYFDPNQMCTREQLAVIFIKAMGIKESEIVGKQHLYIIRQLKDKDKISPWATDFIEFAMDSGLLKGTGGWNFGPDKKAPREQAAVLIDRILENKEDILNFHKSYSGNIQYPELYNALRNREFNYKGSVEFEMIYSVTNNTLDQTIRKLKKLQGTENIHDHQYLVETKNEATGQTPSELRYYIYQIADKTYINTDTWNNYAVWTIKTNDEVGRGEDFEVADAGVDNFDNLFAEYQITKTENVTLDNSPYVDWDDQIATKYSITFTNETIKPFAAMILMNPSIDSKDIQFENVFNKGYSVTANFYLDEMKLLIREEFEFSGNTQSENSEYDLTVFTNSFTKYSELGRDFNMTPP